MSEIWKGLEFYFHMVVKKLLRLCDYSYNYPRRQTSSCTMVKRGAFVYKAKLKQIFRKLKIYTK